MTDASCLRFARLPALPQLRRGNVSRAEFTRHHVQARARLNHFDWFVESSQPEMPAQGLAKRWDGVVFVGDSTLREVTWALIQLLAGPGRELHLRSGSQGGEFAVTTALGHAHNGSCVPAALGKTGWTVFCPHDEASACKVATAFSNRTHEMALVREWLRDDHRWDGRLRAVDDELACSALTKRGTFVAYQGTYHNGEPIDPASLPGCLSRGHADGRATKLLLVANGSPLHQNAVCSPWRLSLPAHVLARILDLPAGRHRNRSRNGLRLYPRAPNGRQRGIDLSVLWQPAGGGWLPQPPPPPGCRPVDIPHIAAASTKWLDEFGVAWYDYTTLAERLAPLMSDGNHFTYFHQRCAQGAPHVLNLAAQLLLRTAADREADGKGVRYCREDDVLSSRIAP